MSAAVRALTSAILTYPSTTNAKTGDVPSVAVGTQAARVESCSACTLRPKAEGGDGRCYARRAFRSVEAGVQVGERAYEAGRKVGFFVGLEGFVAALQQRALSARIVRFGSVGDPAYWTPEEWTFMRGATLGAGLTPICYTSRWREPVAAHLRGQSMASTTSPEEAAEAVNAGWQATTVLPWDHPRDEARFTIPGHGAIGVVCPEQRRKVESCNVCRLCDGTRTIGNPRLPPVVVGFIDHSSSGNARRNAAAARKINDNNNAPQGQE